MTGLTWPVAVACFAAGVLINLGFTRWRPLRRWKWLLAVVSVVVLAAAAVVNFVTGHPWAGAFFAVFTVVAAWTYFDERTPRRQP